MSKSVRKCRACDVEAEGRMFKAYYFKDLETIDDLRHAKDAYKYGIGGITTHYLDLVCCYEEFICNGCFKKEKDAQNITPLGCSLTGGCISLLLIGGGWFLIQLGWYRVLLIIIGAICALISWSVFSDWTRAPSDYELGSKIIDALNPNKPKGCGMYPPYKGIIGDDLPANIWKLSEEDKEEAITKQLQG